MSEVQGPMSQMPPPTDSRSNAAGPAGEMTVMHVIILGLLVALLFLIMAGVVLIKFKAWSQVEAPKATSEKSLPSGRSAQVLFAAPHFTLIDENGAPFTADNLRGKPYICDFIFTTCGSACPIMSHKLAEVQKQTPAGVQLVSFTVNPEHDTPPVLKQYAASYGADPARWHFLTGTTQQMVSTVRDMKIGFQAANPDAPILHSEKFLLIDGDGNVRGIYDSPDEQAMKDLVTDASWLAGRPGGVDGTK